MKPVVESISRVEWEAIAAVPVISKLLQLPAVDGGRVLSDRVVGMKVVGMEAEDVEGDVFLLYAGEEFPWMVHRRKGCECPHLHVAFRQF